MLYNILEVGAKDAVIFSFKVFANHLRCCIQFYIYIGHSSGTMCGKENKGAKRAEIQENLAVAVNSLTSEAKTKRTRYEKALYAHDALIEYVSSACKAK